MDVLDISEVKLLRVQQNKIFTFNESWMNRKEKKIIVII